MTLASGIVEADDRGPSPNISHRDGRGTRLSPPHRSHRNVGWGNDLPPPLSNPPPPEGRENDYTSAGQGDASPSRARWARGAEGDVVGLVPLVDKLRAADEVARRAAQSLR